MGESNGQPEASIGGYYLVLLRPGSSHDCAAESLGDHVAFIDSMIAANAVLLGGDFGEAIGGAESAYLLRTPSLHAARQWAAKDPFVRNAVYEPEVVTWDLVGINLGAVDPELTS